MSTPDTAIVGAWKAPAVQPVLRVRVGATTESLTLATVGGRTYWPTGDNLADDATGSGDLLLVLAAALGTHSQLSGITADVFDGRIEVRSPTAFALEWADPLTTLDPVPLGWATDNTLAALVQTAPNPCPLIWLPGAPTSDDSGERPRPMSAARESASGRVRRTSFGSGAAQREILFRLLLQSRVLTDFADGSAAPWEELSARILQAGLPFRVYKDVDGIRLAAAFAPYRLANQEDLRRLYRRSPEGPTRWDVGPLDLRRALGFANLGDPPPGPSLAGLVGPVARLVPGVQDGIVASVVNYVPFQGQSLSFGTDSGTPLLQSIPPGLPTVEQVDATNTALEPAVNIAAGLENPQVSFVYTLAHLSGNRSIVARAGIGETAYFGLAPGQVPETAGAQNVIDDANVVAAAISVPPNTGMALIHGNQDDLDGTLYETFLDPWLTGTEEDLNAAFGALANPLFIVLSQMSAARNAVAVGHVTMPQRQLAAARGNARIAVACPTYQLETSDGVHLTAQAYVRLGAKLAQAWHVGPTWRGTEPLTTTASPDGRTIRILYNVRQPPLVIDNTTPGIVKPNAGIEVFDDHGALSISSVAIEGNEVVLTLDDIAHVALNTRVRVGGNASNGRLGWRDSLNAPTIDTAWTPIRDSEVGGEGLLGPHVSGPNYNSTSPRGDVGWNWALQSDDPVTGGVASPADILIRQYPWELAYDFGLLAGGETSIPELGGGTPLAVSVGAFAPGASEAEYGATAFASGAAIDTSAAPGTGAFYASAVPVQTWDAGRGIHIRVIAELVDGCVFHLGDRNFASDASISIRYAAGGGDLRADAQLDNGAGGVASANRIINAGELAAASIAVGDLLVFDVTLRSTPGNAAAYDMVFSAGKPGGSATDAVNGGSPAWQGITPAASQLLSVGGQGTSAAIPWAGGRLRFVGIRYSESWSHERHLADLAAAAP